MGEAMKSWWTWAFLAAMLAATPVVLSAGRNTTLVVPVRIDPAGMSLASGPTWVNAAAKFRPTGKPLQVSEALHYIENEFPNHQDRPRQGRYHPMVSTLLDGQATGSLPFAVPWLYRDHLGRAQVSRSNALEGEGHAAQILATLATLGVPLDQVVRAGGCSATVAELVQTLREDFHLDGEVEWKVMALARYAPTAGRWTNRWGQSFSFDEVIEQTLNRRGGALSCHGTHVLQTLAVLVRVDRVQPLWTEPVRDRVLKHLRDVAITLRRNQRRDGAWTPDWRIAHPNSQDQDDDLQFYDATEIALVTGHHLEWLDLLTGIVDLEPATRNAAVAWCLRTTLRVSPADAARSICAYSHCFRVATRDAGPEQWVKGGDAS